MGTSGTAEAELEGFRLAFAGKDGAQHRVPLADAREVQFELMTPGRTRTTPQASSELPCHEDDLGCL
jgi:hypothetical protein